MTDNEIVKALECFSSNEYGCKGCPFIERGCFDCGHIPIEISSSILELINRQKAEIEMDDVEIKELRIALQGYLDDLTKERNLYKKSIEELNQAKAEIERLKQIVGFTPARGSRKSPLLNAVLDNVRAEAYREFAERSEKELFIKQNEHREHWMETLNRHRGTEAYKDHEWSIDNWLRGYGEAVQDILGINQEFLKELVGDSNG